MKLDELVRATQDARNLLVDTEEMPDEELERLHVEFRTCTIIITRGSRMSRRK